MRDSKTKNSDPDPNGCVRDTVITHSRLAWRRERARAATAGRHGLQALPIEGLAARLAGGFLLPIDPNALKSAIAQTLSADLGDLDRIKDLPGFPRAAATTLSKAWTAGLNLAELAANASSEAASRLAAVARLEAEVIGHLPQSMCRPADLVSAALQRTTYARVLFGRIAIHGRTEMSPIGGRCSQRLRLRPTSNGSRVRVTSHPGFTSSASPSSRPHEKPRKFLRYRAP